MTGGHDNVILVWTLDSLGKLINAAHNYTKDLPTKSVIK